MIMYILMIFVLPMLLCFCLIEAITGWTEAFFGRMWSKWKNRKP